MRNILLGMVLSAVSASAVAAETITFESDGEILVIRGRQSGDAAIFELVGERDEEMLCVALDGEGRPVATATGFADMGSVMFRQLEVTAVDRVACRYNR